MFYRYFENYGEIENDHVALFWIFFRPTCQSVWDTIAYKFVLLLPTQLAIRKNIA